MARVSSSQTGPADLPQLVERLHNGGAAEVEELLQEELETIIDDLPLALESESIRDHLPAIVGRIDNRLDRTFRRIIEIARQDDDRSAILLIALEHLSWRGTATEDEFAWLVQQMSRHTDARARLAAFRRASHLQLHAAQVAILDALGAIHPDESIRQADAERRRAAAEPGAEKPAETTAELVALHEAERRVDMAEAPTTPAPLDPAADAGAVMSGADIAGDVADDFGEFDEPVAQPAPELSSETDHTEATDPGLYDPPPHPDEQANAGPAVSWEDKPAEPAVFDESQAPDETWDHKEAPPPDKLTVRTLLRSLEAPPVANLAAKPEPAPANGNGTSDPYPEDEPTVAEDEPTPHVENSLTEEANAASAAHDESSSPEAAAAAAEPEPPKQDPITVRTLLASLDSVMLSNAPGEEPAPATPEPAAVIEEKPEDWNAPADDPEQQRVTVMTMLRSLETVRVKMQALEDTPSVETPVEGAPAAAPVSDAAPAPAPPKPAETKPWSDVDLKPLSPPDRGRRLAKVRRALETPELRRGYLNWLFEREKDTFSVVSVRKEILEFAFERPVFLGFDDATRAKLARWVRERTAADQIAPPAVLAALRRASWTEGEPPQVDEKTRPIVDAATGVLSRVPSEERTALYNRDFTAWLFSIREWEDREVLDRYAKDPSPGVAEGLFRALAAMDGLSARFGGSGGESALEIALGIWDRADNEARAELAKAIAAGWSRGLVLDRRAFFDGFWTRYQQHEAQRPSILVALTSFEKEIEAAQAKAAAAAAPVTATPATAEKKVETPRGGTPKPAFAQPPVEPPTSAAQEPRIDFAAPPPEEAAPAAPVVAPAAAPTRPALDEATAARAAAKPWEEEPIPSKGDRTPRGGTKRPTFSEPPAEPPSAATPERKSDPSGARSPSRGSTTIEPARAPIIAKESKRGEPAPKDPPAAPRTDVTKPSMRMPEDTPPPPPEARRDTPPARPSSFGPPPQEPGDAPPADESTDRFFRMMRKNMEAGMRATATATPASSSPAPVEEEDVADDDVPLPEEGDAIAESPLPKAAAPQPPVTRAPAPSQPGRATPPVQPSAAASAATTKSGAAASAADDRDQEIVLPNEPLRSLAEYTRFLKALSAGRPIDELLSSHAMDYKQYAGCMTAWGRLLQNRPDLALRMGQLLRATS